MQFESFCSPTTTTEMKANMLTSVGVNSCMFEPEMSAKAAQTETYVRSW